MKKRQPSCQQHNSILDNPLWAIFLTETSCVYPKISADTFDFYSACPPFAFLKKYLYAFIYIT